jgi:hypothetical protein
VKSDREGVAIFSGARFDFALNCRRFGNAAPRFPGEERHPSRWAQLAVFKTFEVHVKRLTSVLEPQASPTLFTCLTLNAAGNRLWTLS